MFTNKKYQINRNHINSTPGDTLEKFRIKAHLRAYVKDPTIIGQALLSKAALQLKKLPYNDYDPSESIVTEMVLEAYRLGSLKQRHLTNAGYELIRHSKFRGHNHLSNNRIFGVQVYRNC